MNHSPHFHIPQPCPANWEDMKVADGGRFCELCAKTVLDCSDGDESKLHQAWLTNPEEVCARLPQPQASRYQVWSLVRQTNFGRFRRAVMTLIALLGLAQTPALAQADSTEAKGVIHFSEEFAEADQLRFTGLIREKTSQEALVGASVALMLGDYLVAGAVADEEGRFVLEVPKEAFDKKSRFTLKINYLSHIFIEENIKPRARYFAIELNAEVWLEAVEVAAERPFGKDHWIGSIMSYPVESKNTCFRGLKGKPLPLPRYPSIEEWMWMNLSEVKPGHN